MKNGKLTQLNQQPSGDTGPCHLTVDATGKFVLVAHYGGGSTTVLPIKKDGHVGPVTSQIEHKGSSVLPRQKAPHAHAIHVGPNNKFAFAPDLGIDKVLVFKFDEKTGQIRETKFGGASVDPGSGPRHFGFHPNGKYAYVINEIKQTVTAFGYRAKRGKLRTLQTISTVPEPVKGNSTAEILVHPSGKFLYGSNRGHNSIAMFRVDEKNGKLTALGHEPIRGEIPRNFGIDPTGQFLLAAGQRSNNVNVFRIDPETGKLKFTGNSIEVASPVCAQTGLATSMLLPVNFNLPVSGSMRNTFTLFDRCPAASRNCPVGSMPKLRGISPRIGSCPSAVSLPFFSSTRNMAMLLWPRFEP